MRRIRLITIAVAVSATAACGSGHGRSGAVTAQAPAPPRPTTAAAEPARARSTSSPCGRAATPPASYDHVVWIVMENHPAPAAIDPAQAPYTARLARACGLATDYHAVAHPSLPNYIAMTSGSTQGIADDAGPAAHPVGARSIFAETGGDWRALEDSMPAPCARTDTGRYAVRHDPAVYYTELAPSCSRHVVRLGAVPDLSARFTFVTPDVRDDTHDAPVPTGDAWLARTLAAMLRTPQYRAGRTAIFVTWDEDDGSASNRVALLVIAPTVPRGARDRVPLSHYSLLRTTQELLGLRPLLGRAAQAPSMRSAFGL